MLVLLALESAERDSHSMRYRPYTHTHIRSKLSKNALRTLNLTATKIQPDLRASSYSLA
jgi:hypothetical protein